MNDSLIELRRVSKRFAGTLALDEVSFAVRRGEIHCLAGENGSGKSTIIKIMSGVYQPDEGEILFDGKAVRHLTPVELVRRGVQVIYQDFSLFGNLTVAENSALNSFLRERRRTVSWREVRKIGQQALDRLGVDIDLDAEVGVLPTSSKQLVAIARALMSDARLIIMDEPTTALTRHEVERLMAITRAIQAKGIAVLFVSHKLREVLEISETLTVIRNGRVVVEGPIADFDEASITRHMTGHDISSAIYERPAGEDQTPRIEIKGMLLPGAAEAIDLVLRPGDIIGLTGLIGSGRTEFALTLFGMRPGYAGEIRVDGQPVVLSCVGDAIRCGIAYVRRPSEGLFLTQSVERNILASSLYRVTRGVAIDRGRADAVTEETIAALQIATSERFGPGEPSFRRQPAAGRARALAIDRGAHSLAQRADGWRRYRLEGRDPPHHSRPRREARAGGLDDFRRHPRTACQLQRNRSDASRRLRRALRRGKRDGRRDHRPIEDARLMPCSSPAARKRSSPWCCWRR